MVVLYIYIYRERERERASWIYTYIQKIKLKTDGEKMERGYDGVRFGGDGGHERRSVQSLMHI